jgi:hypothetical protein
LRRSSSRRIAARASCESPILHVGRDDHDDN